VQISGAGTPEKLYNDAVRVEGNEKLIKNKKIIVINYVSFCLSTMLTSKI